MKGREFGLMRTSIIPTVEVYGGCHIIWGILYCRPSGFVATTSAQLLAWFVQAIALLQVRSSGQRLFGTFVPTFGSIPLRSVLQRPGFGVWDPNGQVLLL
uniref:Uncharacterized protein n=1 Tax=Grammatophora oceanica TaxID=210454 RepID=A0A7S1VA12_9STRA